MCECLRASICLCEPFKQQDCIVVAHFQLVKKPRLGSWSFKACDDTKKGSFVVNNLDIGPDPLVFPGPLSVAFSVNVVGSTVKSPLKVAHSRRVA